MFFSLSLTRDVIKAKEDVMTLAQVRRQFDLHLLVKVWALVVIRHGRVHLVGELRAGRLAEDVREASVGVLPHELEHR